jgi:hypothetical protein
MLGPIVEDRAAIEPDHIGHLHGGAFRLERQADALEQSHQRERVVDFHVVEHFVLREVLDPDDQPLAQAAETVRQAGEHRAR